MLTIALAVTAALSILWALACEARIYRLADVARVGELCFRAISERHDDAPKHEVTANEHRALAAWVCVVCFGEGRSWASRLAARAEPPTYILPFDVRIMREQRGKPYEGAIIRPMILNREDDGEP